MFGKKYKVVPQSELKKVKSVAKKAQLDKEAKDRELAEAKKVVSEIPALIEKEVTAKVQVELQKEIALRNNEAMRMRGVKRFNSSQNPDRKPDGDIPFSMMRRMATMYPIARACINRRIRQMIQLEWDITTVDDVTGEEGYTDQINLVKEMFKQPMGHKTRFREMVTLMVNDILTIDATCFEFQRTRGGTLLNLIPVDPTTIALRVTETGGTPEPPEHAYVQIIEGHEVGRFTTNEMIYESMGSRSYSPYGMAPLESLILQCEAAIRGMMYNLNYFKENNVPEGFIQLPDATATSRDQLEEWQDWFDALVAGDPRMTHRLKLLPGGSTYTAAKKPEDMSFERFEMWLLQQTCAVFDVPPQDIGITYQVNKATAESQSDLSRERGLIPLGNFVKEIFDDIIQVELGFDKLQFEWRNINPVDRGEEVEMIDKEIRLGVKSIDEYRIEQGLEPLNAPHMVYTPKGPILLTDITSGKYNAQQEAAATEEADVVNETDKNATAHDLAIAKEEMRELRLWRGCVMADIKKGKPPRTHFESTIIRPEVMKHISTELAKVNTRFHADLVFSQYLDPEIRASLKLLKFSSSIREVEHEHSAAAN